MTTKIIGGLLTALGALLLWAGGIPYLEQTEIIDVGPVRATAETRERIDVPPLAAGAMMALGVGVLVHGSKRR